MKKITMKKITYTIVGIVAVFVLVLGVQSTQAQFKGAGSTSNQRLLTIEGTGENSTSQIAGLEIAPKSDTDKAYRSILNSQAQTFVNTRGGSIRILGTALFNLLTGLQNAELKKSGPGKLNIGYATAPTTNHADLQVSGSIRADGLTKASNLNGDKEPLCVTDFGVLERCDTTTLPLVNVCFEYTATHYTSQPASNDPTGCLAGTYTNATDDADNWNWTCTNGSDVTDCSAPKIPSRLNGK